ncbi:hypothetical protein Tco_1561386 [Tanacetum coccineum]
MMCVIKGIVSRGHGYESFCFDIDHQEEKSSGSTTSRFDHSLPDYDAFDFDDDHIEEKSNGSTTTHSNYSLPEYDSFIFDLLIDPFSPVDRSAFYHEEFADELAHIISPPEYDRFYFYLEADPGDDSLLLTDPSEIDTFLSFLSGNEDKDSKDREDPCLFSILQSSSL